MAAFENIYGLYFPIALSSGAPVEPALEDSIDSSIRTILSWEYSKRHFIYTFGSILGQLVSSPNSDRVLVSIQQYIIRAIRTWETRIVVQEVEVIKNDDGDGLEINIKALIKETQTIYNYTLQT